MKSKFFYQFTRDGELVFACAATSDAEAREMCREYESDVRSGKRKKEVFKLTERFAGESHQEYLARRAQTCDIKGKGTNRAERRANIVAIREKMKELTREKRN
jgi:hypothetical protein